MPPGLDTSIEEIDFSVDPWGLRMSTRIKNALQRNGIMTLGDLMDTDYDDLPQGLSTVSRHIIKVSLKRMGLKLKSRRGIS